MFFFISGSTGGFQPKRPTLLNKTLLNQTQQAQQNTPNRPGSVTGSIEGRLANTSGGRRREFMASSPLHEAPEDEMDLWDQASLDYPGRMSPGGDGWEFMQDENEDIIFYDEPRYHTWHVILLALTWVLAIGMGVPAALFTEYR